MSVVPPQNISVSVKAAIVRDGDVVVVEYDRPSLHYNLPGGRLRAGEGLRDAVVRKVEEETCAEVVVDRLLFVVEYVPERWDFEFGDYQKVQFTFLCHLSPDSPSPAMPPAPEDIQTAVRWVPLATLHELELLPRVSHEIQTTVAAPGPLDPLCDVW